MFDDNYEFYPSIESVIERVPSEADVIRRRFAKAMLVYIAVALIAGLCICILGCTAPAQDVANQAAISNREALADVRATYAATEREIVSLHRAGTLSTERATALVKELQTVARPAIDAAQAALVSGDFDTAIIKAVQAVGAVTTKAAPPVVVHP